VFAIIRTLSTARLTGLEMACTWGVPTKYRRNFKKVSTYCFLAVALKIEPQKKRARQGGNPNLALIPEQDITQIKELNKF